MTTLYRPLLIETAEQAEALPVGTIAWSSDPAHGGPYSIAEKGAPWSDDDAGLYDPPWWIDRGQMGAEDHGMVGWTALVPIEAEEERHAIAECEIGVPGSERITHEQRYVTPWEEA